MLEPDEPHPDKLLHRDVTEKIIGAAFEVYGELGYGFLERVYERALQVELIQRGASAEIEKRTQVQYKKRRRGRLRCRFGCAGGCPRRTEGQSAIRSTRRSPTAQRLEGDRHQSRPARKLRKNEGRIQAPHLLNPCFIRAHPWLLSLSAEVGSLVAHTVVLNRESPALLASSTV